MKIRVGSKEKFDQWIFDSCYESYHCYKGKIIRLYEEDFISLIDIKKLVDNPFYDDIREIDINPEIKVGDVIFLLTGQEPITVKELEKESSKARVILDWIFDAFLKIAPFNFAWFKKYLSGFSTSSEELHLLVDLRSYEPQLEITERRLYCLSASSEELETSAAISSYDIQNDDLLLLESTTIVEPRDYAYHVAIIRSIDNFCRIVRTSEDIKKSPGLLFFPIPIYKKDNEDFAESLISESRYYKSGWRPIEGVLLYTDEDVSIAEYIRYNFAALDEMTGHYLNIYTIEQPTSVHGISANLYWQAKLEKTKYDFLHLMGWTQSKPYDKNKSYKIAKFLGVYPESLPCVIFFGDIRSDEKIVVTITGNEKYFFRKLSSIVFKSCQFHQDQSNDKLAFSDFKNNFIKLWESCEKQTNEHTKDNFIFNGKTVFVNKSRNIHTDGGNYNECIEGNYIEGSYIARPNNFVDGDASETEERESGHQSCSAQNDAVQKSQTQNLILRGNPLSTKLVLANLSRGNLGSAFRILRSLIRAELNGVELNGADLSGADLSGADLSDADLSDADLSGADLSDADLSGADLSYTNLSNTNLSGAKLHYADLHDAVINEGTKLERQGYLVWEIINRGASDTNLSDADLSGVILYDANLSNANLSNANLSGTSLSNANLSSANLSNANLSGTNLSDANLSFANLSGTNLSDANLSFANLSGTNLSDANLSFANLSSADLSSSDLRGANLSSADLSSADLRGANLSDVDLYYANLHYADLHDAVINEGTKLERQWYLVWEIINRGASDTNLSDANLSGTNLSNASLSSINLKGANLSYVNLISADLSYANLSSANLRGADLSYANLSNANLRGADLSYANLSSANLNHTNLVHSRLLLAKLVYTTLIGANLTKTNLIAADLSNVNLTDAKLSDADLRKANVYKAQFGNNPGITEEVKRDLIRRGAILGGK